MTTSSPWWDDPTYDRAVHALLVVGSLQRNQRLTTEAGECMSSEPYHLGQCVLRWLHSESRDANLAAVRCVMLQAADALERAASEEPSSTCVPQHGRRLAARVIAALRGALVGTANLRETYRDDAGTCATIQQIEGHIAELLAEHAELAPRHTEAR